MNKKYYYRADADHQILTVLKWLRRNGTMNVDFKLLQLNYRIMIVEFDNSKLELAYVMNYDWTQQSV